jgi:hypothetical protein
VLAIKALAPTAVLLEPVFALKAHSPIAVFEAPDTLSLNA